MSGRSASGCCAFALLAVLAGGDWPVGDWPMSRHDAQNSGATRLEVEAEAAPRGWTFGLDRHVFGYRPGMSVWSSAAVGQVGGRAAVAAGSYDKNVYLFDAATGEPIWRFTTGNGVYEAPLIWNDGPDAWVFAASSDRLVYGLDAKLGSRRWSRAVAEYSSTLGGSRLSAPCLGEAGGVPAVFVGHWVFDKSLSRSTQQGGLTALEARTGKRLWQTEFLDNRVSSPVYAQVEGRGMIFVASQDGNLRALDADTGGILWSHRETEPIMASPMVHDSPEGVRVVIGSHFGKVRSLDARTGREHWSFQTGNWVTGSAAFYVDGDRQVVAIGSYDRKLYGLDAATGEKIFSQTAAGPIYSSPAVVPAGPAGPEPTIVFSSWDHQMHGVSGRDGTLLWTVFTGKPLWDGVILGESNWASPAAAEIGGRWMLYMGSYNGVFYAIPLSQAAMAGGSQPWTDVRFWITMVLALGLTAVLSLYLTRRYRRYYLP
jgi:outer membrane protein assembly factor BamB